MAATAHKTAEEIQEYYDDKETLEDHARTLADKIRKSNSFIIFTGAGISTACGIPDFRGPDGVWTCRAQGRAVPGGRKHTSTQKAVPSFTHMAIVALVERGLCDYVVSQNCDGLHRRSGIPASKISELHGNSNIEKCVKCKTEYLRDFRCRRQGNKVHDHTTGRVCDMDGCGGKLKDSIINFGENLPPRPLKLAEEAAERADLCLVLGSSCKVTPAADIPESVGEDGRDLMICNLQKTPLDKLCSRRIYAKCDDLMMLVMKNLGVEIPTFVVRRCLSVRQEGTKGAGSTVAIRATDVNGTPAAYFRRVEVLCGGEAVTADAPENALLSKAWLGPLRTEGGGGVEVVLHFVGHYGEGSLVILYDSAKGAEVKYTLDFTPSLKSWHVTKLEAVSGVTARPKTGRK